ncbi:hypothetical protein TanjilG_06596 [Lupinus angustifolius]|uniref:Uncharacterized protein n=1 Tax=Lupinus angustifolius TaxID=3871 RepID=A0A394D9Y3_LUPAN|nr:hypothetical protein TanjilG_06596 [Lupinus angustifolius]
MICSGKHGVDGIFKKRNGIIRGKDILSNSIGTSMDTVDESSSFAMLNYKVALSPLKLSTTDMSSVKNTSQIQTSENSVDHDSDVDSPCWKGTMAICPTPSKTSGLKKFIMLRKQPKNTTV